MIKGQAGESQVLFSQEYYQLLFKRNGNYTVFWDADANGHFGNGGSDSGVSTALAFNENVKGGFWLITNLDSTTNEHEEYFDEVLVEIHQFIIEYLQ